VAEADGAAVGDGWVSAAVHARGVVRRRRAVMESILHKGLWGDVRAVRRRERGGFTDWKVDGFGDRVLCLLKGWNLTLLGVCSIFVCTG
jgi:hypothetical protein